MITWPTRDTMWFAHCAHNVSGMKIDFVTTCSPITMEDSSTTAMCIVCIPQRITIRISERKAHISLIWKHVLLNPDDSSAFFSVFLHYFASDASQNRYFMFSPPKTQTPQLSSHPSKKDVLQMNYKYTQR